MGRKSIIIIGAGLAGLSAGCYAQMNGYESRIFEHHSKPGGVAAWWKKGDFLIDGGIHFLMGHKPSSSIYEVYRELGATQDNKFLDLSTYLRFVDEASGRKVDITADLGRLARSLKEVSPADAGIVKNFLTEAHRLKDSPALMETGMGLPPELMRPVDMVKSLWSMRGLLKFFIGKYSKSVAEYSQNMRSPLLRKIFENLFLPEGPVWFIIMILASVAGGMVGLMEGGCPGFILPIENRYKTLGGQIAYNSTVEKVLVENDKAVGVRLSDGSEHRANIVVSAADGYSTVFGMLDGHYVDDGIRKRYETWALCRPIFTVSFGVARVFPNDSPLNIFLLKEPIRVANRDVDGLSLRIFNYSRRFAPNGKTVIQAMIETEWEYWYQLRKNRASYEVEKSRIAKEVLRRLEAHYPGLSSQVEVTDVATPITTWRYTLNWKGSPMGWLITPKTLMTQIRRSLPGLKDFYIAGQWALPGGGVPGCIYSGRHVIQILCQQDRKPFRTSLL